MKCLLNIVALFIVLFGLITLTSCSVGEKKEKVHLKTSIIKFPSNGDCSLYSYFNQTSMEYFSCFNKEAFYIYDLNKCILIDSINIHHLNKEISAFGDIHSYCFNGRDSLFILLNEAILFVEKQKLKKIIPINQLDSIQYRKCQFSNIAGSHIYFDNKTNEIIGGVYSMEYSPSNKGFYNQKIIGKISILTNKLSFAKIIYPEIYRKNYYGFLNNVFIDNQDSISYLSFDCSDSLYVINRNTNVSKSVFGKSIFQKREILPINISDTENSEIKMRHMLTEPIYNEIRYDKHNNFLYRFFYKELDYKNNKGKYNTINDKVTYLQIFNNKYELLTEQILEERDNKYITFVGTKGLYINTNFSEKPTDSISFKIISIEK